MRSVTVRIYAVEFSATIAAISEWLRANQYGPQDTNTRSTKMLPCDRRLCQ
jgi:hypothetical protein